MILFSYYRHRVTKYTTTGTTGSAPGRHAAGSISPGNVRVTVVLFFDTSETGSRVALEAGSDPNNVNSTVPIDRFGPHFNSVLVTSIYGFH